MKRMHVHVAVDDLKQSIAFYSAWIDDPAGIAWETFLTTGESTDYGDGSGERVARVAHEKSCCVPQVAAPAAACGCPTV
jgi:hypothetical protein